MNLVVHVIFYTLGANNCFIFYPVI